MRSVGLFAVLLVALFILGSAVSIQTAHAFGNANWTGSAGDGKWENPLNWDCNCVPGPGYNVFIPAGAFAVTISTAQSAQQLVVSVGDTVICESTCTLTLTIVLTNLGTFTNFGTVTTGSLGNNKNAIFTNHGTVTISGSGLLINQGTFTNYGTVTLPTELINSGTFTNRCHGTINKGPDAPSRQVGTFTTDPTCPSVGGEVTSVKSFSVLAPWLAVIGLVGCIATVAVIIRKRRP